MPEIIMCLSKSKSKALRKMDWYAVALFLTFSGLIIFGWYEVIYGMA